MEAICQSCAMPLTRPEERGTEKDGSTNADYCIYCYKDGGFTREETMDAMIETCVGYLDEFNKDSPEQLTPDQARARMKRIFPELKRWRNGG